MFERVLVATDLSPASHRVIRCIGGLRALGTREIVLGHCLSVSRSTPLEQQLRCFAESSLHDETEALAELGFEVRTEIVLGHPQVEISRLAQSRGCSLIVVGSHGHTLVNEVMLGGVASAVIHGASTPVLVIRLLASGPFGRATCESGPCDFLGHVLFPTDFSDNAERAFGAVEEVVSRGAKSVTLLHVQDQARIGRHLEDRLEEFNAIDLARLERMRDRLKSVSSAEVQVKLAWGSPIREILKHIRESQCSFVIMGSQGRGFISEIFLGSVSHHVARQSPAPVLLIPVPRARE